MRSSKVLYKRLEKINRVLHRQSLDDHDTLSCPHFAQSLEASSFAGSFDEQDCGSGASCQQPAACSRRVPTHCPAVKFPANNSVDCVQEDRPLAHDKVTCWQDLGRKLAQEKPLAGVCNHRLGEL